MRSLDAARPALAGLLVASFLLGAIDASLAIWANRAVAPHATLPLCLTAPFVVALVVLAPLALPLPIARAARTPRGATSALVACVAGLLVLRVTALVREAWAGGGAGALAAALVPVGIAAAIAAAWITWRAAHAMLAWAGERSLSALVVTAAVVQGAALLGLGAQVARESRGLVADLLARDASASSRVKPVPAARARGAGAPPAADNLVLITIDTLRADHLDAARMPRTTELAARGARFDAAFAASSWTLPSLASLMTGLPVARHRAGEAIGVDPLARRPLGDQHATLATVLRRTGFATRGIVTNPYLGLGYGLGRGFDAFENVTLEGEAVLTLRPTTGFWLLESVWPSVAIADRGDAVTRRAARFLSLPERPERFFLWLHYVDPHAPYAGTTRSFRDDLLAGDDGGALPRMAQLRAGEIRPLAEGRRALRAAYADAVRAVDAEVGALADLLDAHGLAARTLLVITADHGEELWDHGGIEHGHTLYAELTRVPLVLVHPGSIRAGTEVAALVGTQALAATLLELLGVEAEPSEEPLLPPASFAATLAGAPFAERPVVSENLLFAEERVALRTARHTYVVWPNGKEELYDRTRDPGELRDLTARRRLLRTHRALLAASRASPGASDAAPEEASAGTGVSGVTRRALQALGYVE